jgi:hypothetical protein
VGGYVCINCLYPGRADTWKRTDVDGTIFGYDVRNILRWKEQILTRKVVVCTCRSHIVLYFFCRYM